MSQIYDSIKTKSPEYQNTYSKYKEDFDNFFSYEETASTRAGTKSNNGRPSSYRRFAVKSLYIYQKRFGKLPDTLTDIGFINNLLSILNEPGFILLNQESHRFYQAAIKEFIRYLVSIDGDLAEKLNNPHFLKEENYQTKKLFDDYKNEIKQDVQPITKRRSKYIKKSSAYPRNSVVKELVKEAANYKCEYDPSHTTFINENDGNQYMEAHHLIPMSAQDYFENSVDFPDNMISLCPTCHRRIHLADKADRKRMIEHFYNLRKDKYAKHGIDINLKELLSFYGI